MVSQGRGHLQATVILRLRLFRNQMVMCFNIYPEAGSWLSSKCLSLLVYYRSHFAQQPGKISELPIWYKFKYIYHQNHSTQKDVFKIT